MILDIIFLLETLNPKIQPIFALDIFDICRSSSQLIELFARRGRFFAKNSGSRRGLNNWLYLKTIPAEDRNITNLTATYYNQQICEAH